MITRYEFSKMGKEAVFICLRYCLSVCLMGLKEIVRITDLRVEIRMRVHSSPKRDY